MAASPPQRLVGLPLGFPRSSFVNSKRLGSLPFGSRHRTLLFLLAFRRFLGRTHGQMLQPSRQVLQLGAKMSDLRISGLLIAAALNGSFTTAMLGGLHVGSATGILYPSMTETHAV